MLRVLIIYSLLAVFSWMNTAYAGSELPNCYKVGYLACSAKRTCVLKPGQYHGLCVMLDQLDKGYDYTCQFEFKEGVAFHSFVIDYAHANKIGMHISQLQNYTIKLDTYSLNTNSAEAYFLIESGSYPPVVNLSCSRVPLK